MAVQKFDLVSADFKRDPYPTFRTMRQRGPLVQVKLPVMGRVWLTTTYAATAEMLRTTDLFANNPANAGHSTHPGLRWWMPRAIRVLLENMLAKDEPDHRRLRRIVEAAFVRRSIEGMRPRLVELADQQLDHLESRSNGEGIVPFLAEYARLYPLAVISELLGLPDEDRPQFAAWANALAGVTSLGGAWRAFRATPKMFRYLKTQFERQRARRTSGLLANLIEEEQEGDRLSEDELLAMTFLLLMAGHETTTHLLTGSVWTLTRHPGELARLRTDWGFAANAVMEVMRHFSSVQITKPRFVRRDGVFHGQPLIRGEQCIPFIAAGNADPERYPDPERFDITRKADDHLGFGSGPHVCLGSKLARAEVEITLERLWGRFPDVSLGFEPDATPWHARLGHRSFTAFPLHLNGGIK